MRRVTIKEAIDAYEKTGLVPYRGSYLINFDGVPHGCVIGALGLANSPDGEAAIGNCIGNIPANINYLLDLNSYYKLGLIQGFDHKNKTWAGNNINFNLGIEDGKAIARAVGL